jgi:hypothetical protein
MAHAYKNNNFKLHQRQDQRSERRCVINYQLAIWDERIYQLLKTNQRLHELWYTLVNLSIYSSTNLRFALTKFSAGHFYVMEYLCHK